MVHSIKQYRWIAINSNGKKITGIIHAKNKQDANAILMQRDITPLSIQTILFSTSIFSYEKITKKQLLDFTQQLHTLLQANISIIDAFTLIASTTQNNLIKKIADHIIEKIQLGTTLSVALSLYPEHFDALYCQLIYAGEQSGQLLHALAALHTHLTRQFALENKIKRALFYPLCVLCIALFITIGLLVFVIPEFSAIYQNFNAQLPYLTQCLISLSVIICNHSVILILIFILCFLIFKLIISKKISIKSIAQQILFKTPFLKKAAFTQQITQWIQVLCITLSSQLSLIDALKIANNAVTHPTLRNQLNKTKMAIMNGFSFHTALDLCELFPLRAKQLITIGENADALVIMLTKIAALYDQELQDNIEYLSKLVEPVMMIFIAVLIGILIIAMYLPIFKMGNII